MRGATTGAIGGGILGGLGAGETQVPRTITDDLTRHNLKNLPIKPGELAYASFSSPGRPASPRPSGCSSRTKTPASCIPSLCRFSDTALLITSLSQ